MHPSLPDAFRLFLSTFEGTEAKVYLTLEEQKTQDAQFLERLTHNDAALKKRYPAYEVWPIDAQVALHAMYTKIGIEFDSNLRKALGYILPDFIGAAYFSSCPSCSLNWNLAIAQLFKNAAIRLAETQEHQSKVKPVSFGYFGFDLPNEVEKVGTPVSVNDFLNALSNVFLQIEGVRPTINQLAALYGQWSMETNTGRAMFNNAVANLKITQNQMNSGVLFFSQFTGAPGVIRADGVPGEGVNHFRAYVTLEDGIRSWIGQLKAPLYKSAWDALKADDLNGFANQVSIDGWVPTQSQSSYTAGILSRANDFLKNIAPTFQLNSPNVVAVSNPVSGGMDTSTKAKIAVGIGGLAALGTAYLIVHPIAAISTAAALHSVYKKGKEFLNPSLEISKKVTR